MYIPRYLDCHELQGDLLEGRLGLGVVHRALYKPTSNQEIVNYNVMISFSEILCNAFIFHIQQ